MVYRFQNPAADKDKRISQVAYGRRYIIEGPDAVLNKYEESKLKGDNNVILDRLFNEYLTVKYNHDPEWLRIELNKASAEPYLHQTLEQVNTIFGPEEARRKVLFEKWWRDLPLSERKGGDNLDDKYQKWFEDQNQVNNQNQ